MLTQEMLDALCEEVPKSKDGELRKAWGNVLRCLRAVQRENEEGLEVRRQTGTVGEGCMGRIETQMYLFGEYWKQFVQMAVKVPELARIIGNEEIKECTQIRRMSRSRERKVSTRQLFSQDKADSAIPPFHQAKGEVQTKQLGA